MDPTCYTCFFSRKANIPAKSKEMITRREAQDAAVETLELTYAADI